MKFTLSGVFAKYNQFPIETAYETILPSLCAESGRILYYIYINLFNIFERRFSNNIFIYITILFYFKAYIRLYGMRTVMYNHNNNKYVVVIFAPAQ